MTSGFLGDIYEKKREREKYIGRWLVITTSGQGNSEAGLVQSIDSQGYATLSPFQKVDYVEGNESLIESVFKLSEGESEVPLQGSKIEDTTRENLENFCKFKMQKNDSIGSKNNPTQKHS